jgi:hypothetical protein
LLHSRRLWPYPQIQGWRGLTALNTLAYCEHSLLNLLCSHSSLTKILGYSSVQALLGIIRYSGYHLDRGFCRHLECLITYLDDPIPNNVITILCSHLSYTKILRYSIVQHSWVSSGIVGIVSIMGIVRHLECLIIHLDDPMPKTARTILCSFGIISSVSSYISDSPRIYHEKKLTMPKFWPSDINSFPERVARSK